MRLRKVALSLATTALGIGLTVGGTSIQPAQAAGSTLAFTLYKQEQTNWCWATATSQCTLAKKGLNKTSCTNTAGTLTQTATALKYAGATSVSRTSPLSFASMQSQINNKHPIIQGIRWTGGGGHMLVIMGWDIAVQTNTQKLTWSDPGTGKFSTNTYAYLVKNSSSYATENLTTVKG